MDVDESPIETADRLIGESHPAEAAALLERCLAEGRGGLWLRLFFVRALWAAGKKEDALHAAREAAQLYPGAAAAALGHGEALAATEQIADAISEFERALSIDPSLDAARQALGEAWLAAGEAEKALAEFARLPAETPALEEKIAAARAMQALPRAPAGYVRHLFDQFSADYDARMLHELGYRAPAILHALFAMVAPGETGFAALDLGCGTGLCGEAFRGEAAAIDGIDLSPDMIAKAGARGIYRRLFVADIEAPPVAPASYEIALAADTLVYLGDLEPLFAAVFAALKSGGRFLFTVERGEGEGFDLGRKRRWRHSESYLRRAAATSGFEMMGLLSCILRYERAVPVQGFAVALAKP